MHSCVGSSATNHLISLIEGFGTVLFRDILLSSLFVPSFFGVFSPSVMAIKGNDVTKD